MVMQHDCDASAALLEHVNHALNSGTSLRIQGVTVRRFSGVRSTVSCWILAPTAASSAMTRPSW